MHQKDPVLGYVAEGMYIQVRHLVRSAIPAFTKTRVEENKMSGQKITPFLWFEDKAEEAAKFYVSLFNSNPKKRQESKIEAVALYDEAGAEASGRPAGSVMTVSFKLDGQRFTAINGGPQFKFTSAVSFVVDCETQEEVDHFWDSLSEGGEEGVCGWINRDRFGITWQVVPGSLPEYLGDQDKEKAGRVMRAMLKMKKIDISQLKMAYEGN